MAIKEKWFRITSLNHSLLNITAFAYVIAYPICYKYIQQMNSEIAQFYLTSIFFACLLHVCDKFLSENTLTVFIANFGRISYGCYLYHFIVLSVFIKFSIFYDENGFSIFGVLLALTLTCFISHFSYYYYEIYFLKKGLKYKP